MAGLIPERFIDELLARIDIVEVIERRVPLKRAGREWTACCPFHDERTPSFTVSPQKQFYHCFGCGAHGSAIRFLMDYEHLEFPDAIEELAQGAGLSVPREGGDAPRADHGELYALLAEAASWYAGELPKSAAARAYCEQRGLDAGTIEAFHLGWAPAGWDGIRSRLGTTPERMRQLEQAGMLSVGEGGKKYDRFRERLMFPIQDRRGRVIAFGGRVLSAEQSPKYLNSPETPLFHKGRELFALWQVKQANAQLKRIVVVEGYMDVIALHQAGLPIAVATLGTATTPEHAQRLFRAAPDVVFCFDGDRAGRAAAWKALDAALPQLRDGRQAFFLFLPEGEDPDSLVRKEGREGFEQRLREATPLSEYFFTEIGRDIALGTRDGRARLAEKARPLLERLPDGSFRDLMLDELAQRSGVRERLRAPSPGHRPPPRTAQRKRTLVRSAIALLLAEPTLAHTVPTPYAFAELDLPGLPLLVELLDLARSHEAMTTAMLLHHFDDRPEAQALSRLAASELQLDPDALRAEFAGALVQLRRQTLAQQIDALIARQAERGLDPEEKSRLRELLASKER
ncbi:MAG TPA: DNA primase [Rhodanobacteraceae bacterium]|nr:DNA primase [Rhodanobacteraceae bacterium]